MSKPRLATDIMITRLHTLLPEQNVLHGVRQLLKCRISGAPVIDHHNSRFTVLKIGDPNAGAKSQRLVGRGHGVHVVDLAAGSLTAVKAVVIVGGDAFLGMTLLDPRRRRHGQRNQDGYDQGGQNLVEHARPSSSVSNRIAGSRWPTADKGVQI